MEELLAWRRGLMSLFDVDAHAVLHVELARIEDVLVVTGRFGVSDHG